MSDLILGDCIKEMQNIPDSFVKLTITDIPYGKVNRKDNGLRNLNKDKADIETFDLEHFLTLVYRITEGTIIIFCGNEQYSKIYNFLNEKSKNNEGTTRQLIWAKSNPSPMNGEYVYLNSTENAVWFRKKSATFNARCKKNYFIFPIGKSKLHPTEKNHELLRELILDNSNFGDLVFDPCMGSGSHLLIAWNEGRKILGIELNKEYFEIAENRLKSYIQRDGRPNGKVENGLNFHSNKVSSGVGADEGEYQHKSDALNYSPQTVSKETEVTTPK